MLSSLKNNIKKIIFYSILLIGCCYPLLNNNANADAPVFKDDFSRDLTTDSRVLNPEDFNVKEKNDFRQNIVALFYPQDNKESSIYKVLRGITLGVMIIFIIVSGASLLLNKDSKETKSSLKSLLYILLGGVFIYAANWIFGSVFDFNLNGGEDYTTANRQGIGGFADSLVGRVFFVVLSAVKAFAFFLAIIMIVVTGFRVIAAGEGDKGKKLIKGVINVVVSLLIIKGVDFIYYLAADSNFVGRTSTLIIDIAKLFAYIYGVVIVIMVIVSGYLYMTDGGSGSNFKKASNILVNILLSGLVLFAFLLITYQIFAEFQTGGDAVESTAYIGLVRNIT